MPRRTTGPSSLPRTALLGKLSLSICQNNVLGNLTSVRIQVSFILKEEVQVGCKLFGVESFVLASVHIGQITIFLQISNKTNVTLGSATFYLYMSGKVL